MMLLIVSSTLKCCIFLSLCSVVAATFLIIFKVIIVIVANIHRAVQLSFVADVTARWTIVERKSYCSPGAYNKFKTEGKNVKYWIAQFPLICCSLNLIQCARWILTDFEICENREGRRGASASELMKEREIEKFQLFNISKTNLSQFSNCSWWFRVWNAFEW